MDVLEGLDDGWQCSTKRSSFPHRRRHSDPRSSDTSPSEPRTRLHLISTAMAWANVGQTGLRSLTWRSPTTPTPGEISRTCLLARGSPRHFRRRDGEQCGWRGARVCSFAGSPGSWAYTGTPSGSIWTLRVRLPHAVTRSGSHRSLIAWRSTRVTHSMSNNTPVVQNGVTPDTPGCFRLFRRRDATGTAAQHYPYWPDEISSCNSTFQLPKEYSRRMTSPSSLVRLRLEGKKSRDSVNALVVPRTSGSLSVIT